MIREATHSSDRRVGVLLLGLLIASSVASANQLSGRVIDSSTAVVAGATVPY